MKLRTVGQAVTPLEKDIEALIAEAPIFRTGKALEYGPVSGGISNENWRVREIGGAGDWFVKIPGNGTEMFIDRATALDASRKAAAAGLGPAVYDDLAHRDIEINDFLSTHRPSTNSDFTDPVLRFAAIDCYRKLHAMEPLLATKTVFDMIDEHLAQIDALDAKRLRNEAWIRFNVTLAREAFEASGLDLVPSFNDPMPGNFMIGPDTSITLIDYEYASMNDRCYDLGIWFGEMFFTSEQELALIERYFGEVRPEIISRVTVHKALADVKWSLWSMVQLSVSRLNFDFHKYGMWKLMRFRSIADRPDWSRHLRTL